MKDFLIGKVAPLALAAVGVAAALWVLRGPAEVEVKARTADQGVGSVASQFFDPSNRPVVKLLGEPSDLPGLWPNFRGPRLDGVSDEKVPLSRSWPADGPHALWSVDLGEGYAGPAVRDGKVYLLDYDPPDLWLIRAEDVRDWSSLLAKFEMNNERVLAGPYARIWEFLPTEIRHVFAQAPAGPLDEPTQAGVIRAFNDILPKRDFYRSGDFQDFKLPSETRRFLEMQKNTATGEMEITLRSSLTDAEVLRFNRILLETAFGPALARSEHCDVMRCMSLADGRDIWRFSYPLKVKRNHGMSRTVPAVTDKYVVSLGPKCHVVCLDSQTGQFRWGIDLQERYRTQEPPWYAGQCPLIDGGRAIIAPGGSALMFAKDLDSEGTSVAWETPNPHNWQMTHSSIVPVDFAGRRIYVYCASGGVVGVDAADGRILWESTDWKIAIATVPSPVVLPDNRIFFSGGYEAGCMMMQLTQEGERIIPRVLWRLPADQFGSTQQTPIFYNGFLYGVRPDGQLVCLGLDGKVRWTSGSANRFGQGLGPYIIADGIIFVMNDTGGLSMVEANNEAFRPLGKTKVLSGHDSWGPMAIVGGRLLARDLTRIVCLDVKAQ